MSIAYVYEEDSVIDKKIENATACKKILKKVSKTNAIIIADYINSMQTEINPSTRYKRVESKYFEHAVNNEGELPTHAISTTVKGIVGTRQFLFNNLWKRATIGA